MDFLPPPPADFARGCKCYVGSANLFSPPGLIRVRLRLKMPYYSYIGRWAWNFNVNWQRWGGSSQRAGSGKAHRGGAECGSTNMTCNYNGLSVAATVRSRSGRAAVMHPRLRRRRPCL